MNNQMCRVAFSTMEWTTPAHDVRVKLFKHEGRQLRLVEFGKGFVEPDWCSSGHIGYVLEGSMKLAFEDTTVVLGPGDGVFIPSGQQHKHKGEVLSDAFRVVLVEDVG